MRTTLKIVLPLIVSVAAVSLLFAAYQVRTQKRILRNELSRQAESKAESLQESVEPLLDRVPDRNLQRLVDRFSAREHLKGVAVYDNTGTVEVATSGLTKLFPARPAAASRAALLNARQSEFLSIDNSAATGINENEAIHVEALPLHRDGTQAGTLAIFHDATYIDNQLSNTLRDSLVNALIQTLLITGLALVLVRWTFTGPLARTTKWLHTLRTGQTHQAPALPNDEIF